MEIRIVDICTGVLIVILSVGQMIDIWQSMKMRETINRIQTEIEACQRKVPYDTDDKIINIPF